MNSIPTIKTQVNPHPRKPSREAPTGCRRRNSLEEIGFQTADGRITILGLTRLVTDVAGQTDVAGFGFTEHLPWDAVQLKTMMEAFSFMK